MALAVASRIDASRKQSPHSCYHCFTNSPPKYPADSRPAFPALVGWKWQFNCHRPQCLTSRLPSFISSLTNSSSAKMCAWGNSVTLQEVRSSRRRVIHISRSIFPGVVPAGERDPTSVAAERGTIWTPSDIDQIASGARQRPTARLALELRRRNITAPTRAESKRL